MGIDGFWSVWDVCFRDRSGELWSVCDLIEVFRRVLLLVGGVWS